MSCWTKALPPTTTSAPRFNPRNVATKRSRSSVRHRSNPGPTLAITRRPRAPSRSVNGQAISNGTSASVIGARSAGGIRSRAAARSAAVIDASVCFVSSLRMSPSSARLSY